MKQPKHPFAPGVIEQHHRAGFDWHDAAIVLAVMVVCAFVAGLLV